MDLDDFTLTPNQLAALRGGATFEVITDDCAVKVGLDWPYARLSIRTAGAATASMLLSSDEARALLAGLELAVAALDAGGES